MSSPVLGSGFQVRLKPKPSQEGLVLQPRFNSSFGYWFGLMVMVWMLVPSASLAADKLVALYSAHAVPYAMPWVAEEMGMFKKYDLDFEFVYIPSSATATAALLGATSKWAYSVGSEW